MDVGCTGLKKTSKKQLSPRRATRAHDILYESSHTLGGYSHREPVHSYPTKAKIMTSMKTIILKQKPDRGMFITKFNKQKVHS